MLHMFSIYYSFFFFFFFQAEDGIRDWSVTGVQTCALPIYDTALRRARMHGLWALIGSGALDPAFHAKLLTYPDEGFRAWGVRAAGNQGKVEPAIRDTVLVR